MLQSGTCTSGRTLAGHASWVTLAVAHCKRRMDMARRQTQCAAGPWTEEDAHVGHGLTVASAASALFFLALNLLKNGRKSPLAFA